MFYNRLRTCSRKEKKMHSSVFQQWVLDFDDSHEVCNYSSKMKLNESRWVGRKILYEYEKIKDYKYSLLRFPAIFFIVHLGV